MSKHECVYTLLIFVLCTSCKSGNKTELPNDDLKSKTKGVTASHKVSVIKRYGQGIIIENSGPNGGPYTNPKGKHFGSAIIWTRVANETAAPLELTIEFPADSFAIPPTRGSYLKLYLPPDTMTFDKGSSDAYGATGLKSFLDAGLTKPTRLHRTINPKEEYLFNIGALAYQSGGRVRAGLVLKGQDLFYSISILPNFDSVSFPCGHIVLKK